MSNDNLEQLPLVSFQKELKPRSEGSNHGTTKTSENVQALKEKVIQPNKLNVLNGQIRLNLNDFENEVSGWDSECLSSRGPSAYSQRKSDLHGVIRMQTSQESLKQISLKRFKALQEIRQSSKSRYMAIARNRRSERNRYLTKGKGLDDLSKVSNARENFKLKLDSAFPVKLPISYTSSDKAPGIRRRYFIDTSVPVNSNTSTGCALNSYDRELLSILERLMNTGAHHKDERLMRMIAEYKSFLVDSQMNETNVINLSTKESSAMLSTTETTGSISCLPNFLPTSSSEELSVYLASEKKLKTKLDSSDVVRQREYRFRKRRRALLVGIPNSEQVSSRSSSDELDLDDRLLQLAESHGAKAPRKEMTDVEIVFGFSTRKYNFVERALNVLRSQVEVEINLRMMIGAAVIFCINSKESRRASPFNVFHENNFCQLLGNILSKSSITFDQSSEEIRFLGSAELFDQCLNKRWILNFLQNDLPQSQLLLSEVRLLLLNEGTSERIPLDSSENLENLLQETNILIRNEIYDTILMNQDFEDSDGFLNEYLRFRRDAVDNVNKQYTSPLNEICPMVQLLSLAFALSENNLLRRLMSAHSEKMIKFIFQQRKGIIKHFIEKVYQTLSQEVQPFEIITLPKVLAKTLSLLKRNDSLYSDVKRKEYNLLNSEESCSLKQYFDTSNTIKRQEGIIRHLKRFLVVKPKRTNKEVEVNSKVSSQNDTNLPETKQKIKYDFNNLARKKSMEEDVRTDLGKTEVIERPVAETKVVTKREVSKTPGVSEKRRRNNCAHFWNNHVLQVESWSISNNVPVNVSSEIKLNEFKKHFSLQIERKSSFFQHLTEHLNGEKRDLGHISEKSIFYTKHYIHFTKSGEIAFNRQAQEGKASSKMKVERRSSDLISKDDILRIQMVRADKESTAMNKKWMLQEAQKKKRMKRGDLKGYSFHNVSAEIKSEGRLSTSSYVEVFMQKGSSKKAMRLKAAMATMRHLQRLEEKKKERKAQGEMIREDLTSLVFRKELDAIEEHRKMIKLLRNEAFSKYSPLTKSFDLNSPLLLTKLGNLDSNEAMTKNRSLYEVRLSKYNIRANNLFQKLLGIPSNCRAKLATRYNQY